MAHLRGALKKFLPNWADLSLRVKGLIVVSVPLAAILLAIAFMQRLETAKSEAEAAAKNTQEVRSQLQTLYIVLISAESEIRNLGLNGHEEGLQPFGMVGPSIDALFTKMGDLLHKDREHSERLTRLKQLVRERLDGLKDLRAFYEAPETRHAPSPDRLVQRAKVSPDVLLALTEIDAKENKLQQERTKRDETRHASLRFAILVRARVGVFGGAITPFLSGSGIGR